MLEDTDLGQTINPRALSDAEAEYWNEISAEFTSNREPTALPPAIDRTIVETRLQLRNQSVATQIQSEEEGSDYRLVRLLGRGGMGNVFVARQGSLDRLIAVKVIRPLDSKKRERLSKEGKLEQVEQGRRQQFLSEAVVTGDLDHPNIVPIHDIAVTGDKTLFYSMKRVVGTPWSDVIGEKSRDENLDILIKVADAIGFAHTRGVVHRDIKPENVMLGDFGVVMVMDWGIALAKPEFEKLDSITPATRLGGTPSMMAPEMAIGPVDNIGPAADIYLLGATLFMVITGQPPHHAANVSQCLRAVANNDIREYDPKHNGELMNIALKAMAADPKDRYANTTEFQAAIREYRSHAESISLAARAHEDLEQAIQEKSYPQFTRAQFGFEEALALWDGNKKASDGLKQTPISHAEAAYDNQDYDLGLSLLDAKNTDHTRLIERLQEALRQRQKREAAFALLKKVAVAMLAFILIGGSIALYFIQEASNRAQANYNSSEKFRILAQGETARANNNARKALKSAEIAEIRKQEAERQKNAAIQNLQIAKAERDRADKNAGIAKANEIEAKENANRANRNARAAQIARTKAEREAYVSGVGLAKARIDRNEFTEARRLIAGLIGERSLATTPWELRYLSSLANQADAAAVTPAVVANIAIPPQPSGDVSALVRFDNGSLASLQLADSVSNPQKANLSLTPVSLPSADNNRSRETVNATCVGVNSDGSLAVVGTQGGNILLWDPRRTDAPAKQVLRGHRDRVTDVKVINDQYLASASADRTIRIWEIASGDELETMWHIAPVVALSASPTSDGFRLAAAIAEKGLGQVVLWKARTDTPMRFDQIGVFDEHTQPVACVAMSPDTKTVASGDIEGNVFVWSADELQNNDVAKLVKQAVRASGPGSSRPNASNRNSDQADLHSRFHRLVRRIAQPSETASTPKRSSSSTAATSSAHELSVRNVRFSDDGTTLLTCGDDYLTRLWRTGSQSNEQWELTRTLKGHGGPVIDAVFVPDTADRVLTAGADQSLRLWRGDGAAAVSSPDVSVTTQAPQNQTVSKQTSANQTPPAGIEPTTTKIHDDEIWSASISPDGLQIVTASRDRTSKVLAIDPATLTLQKLAELQPDEESETDENSDDASQSFSPIADLAEGSSFRAMSMGVDVTSRRLFVGGADSVIRVWDLDRGTELETISGTGLNQAFSLSRDANAILTGSSSTETNAIVWAMDPATNSVRLNHRLQDTDAAGHEESIAAVALSPDASRAVTADRAGRVILWDCQTGTPIGSPIDDLLGTRINDAEFTPDGRSVWLAADDQRLSRLNLESREIDARLEHDGFVTNVKQSRDGRRVITTSELQKINSTVHRAIWWELDKNTDAPARQMKLTELTVASRDRTRSGGRPGIASVALDESGHQAIVSINPPGDSPSRVQRWRAVEDVRNAKRVTVLGLPARIGDVSDAVPVSDDELVTMHGNSAFRWNTESRQLETSYRINGALSVAAFAPQRDLVATGSRSLKLWDTRTGRAIGKLESPHTGGVQCISFVGSSSAKTPTIEFYTGGDDGFIRRWTFERESSEFAEVSSFDVNSDINSDSELNSKNIDRPLSITLSPDERSLFITTSQGKVLLRDIAANESRVLLDDANVGAIHAGCFSSDGRFVAAAGRDRLARMWDLSRTSSALNAPDAIFQGHAESIHDVALIGNIVPETPSRSTLRLITASQDRSVRVWDPLYSKPPEAAPSDREGMIGPEGRELLELLRHSDGVMSVDFNTDETLMMTAGRDGNVVLWPAATTLGN
ncbi:Serine/threonine protein kinase-related protein [Rhodopirellula sallentina SM41]|uniref:Serine/threonine protein kinase-related protein n=1 Tax=Rhodopirellula sallentina SM41 TaxID=1263870 RepID=M5U317_9BACT|nr:Serine/threonine protein kinase-related protein [Rhodopirellula sallentina SM41]